MDKTTPSISIAHPEPELSGFQKLCLGIFSLALLSLGVAAFGGGSTYPNFFFWTSIGLGTLSASLYIIQKYSGQLPGIKNNHYFTNSLTSRGAWAWVLGIIITGFYIQIYWFPQGLTHLIIMTSPAAKLVRGYGIESAEEGKWFFYGLLYTIIVVVMGFKAIYKYRHSSYQIIRTSSIMFFQLGFAFLLPNILLQLNQPYFEWTNIWPVRYYELFPSSVTQLMQGGAMGKFMLFWAVISIAVITPILTYFFGKRWYCSWVCGCGGLANTAGDPFRHLSDKSLKAWKIERWLIHGVLVFIVVTTGLLWVNEFWGGELLGAVAGKLASWYGFFIGAAFSGVIGVGFYPLMGTRVWCRFGCPMAAILGFQQRFFSRFRITTNGGQCISCGNCSTFCEMGIDVRWYAQRGQNIVRSSCVGCGMCATVCPRGVLNLENGPLEGRINENPIVLGHNDIEVLS